jgi:hypothetical protein
MPENTLPVVEIAICCYSYQILDKSFGSKKVLAREAAVHPSFVTNVLLGRRRSPRLLEMAERAVELASTA